MTDKLDEIFTLQKSLERMMNLDLMALVKNLEQIITEESTASHQLVEECMLLANIEASKKVATTFRCLISLKVDLN